MRMLPTGLAIALAAGLLAPQAASARMSRAVSCENPRVPQWNCIGSPQGVEVRARYVRVRVPPPPPRIGLPENEVAKILLHRADGGGNSTGGGAGGGAGGGGGGGGR